MKPTPVEKDHREAWWPIWTAYLLLVAIGVPWYWPSGRMILWFGWPAWVLTAVASSLAASALTAWVLGRRWPGEEGERG